MSSLEAFVASAALDFVLASAFFSTGSDFLLAGSEPRCSDTVTVTASLRWESYVSESKNAPPNTSEGGN